MVSLADIIAKFMKLHSNIKRMDSLMIAANIKSMSRLELLYTCNANAVRLIHRLGLDNLITSDLLHYLDEDDMNQVIYYSKSEEVSIRLSKVISEAVELRAVMSGDDWMDFPEYIALTRVITDQTSLPKIEN